MAPDFDAMVLAAAEFEQSAGADPSQISGPHQPRSSSVKIARKPLGGEFRLAPIAMGRVPAHDHDLADVTGRDRLPVVANKRNFDASCKMPDRKHPVGNPFVLCPAGPGDGRGLGGCKHMNECAAARKMLPERIEIVGCDRLRRQPHRAHVGEYQPIVDRLDQRAKDRSR